MSRYWRCRRVSDGVVCGTLNLSRKRKCSACGRPKPLRRRPKHMRALDLPYEEWIVLNGGERCGICGRAPSASRRLDRDHCHASGAPRGLLCARCNRALPSWMTSEWLRGAVAYLERRDVEEGRSLTGSVSNTSAESEMLGITAAGGASRGRFMTDFEQRVRGEITSEEYVRRLRAKVSAEQTNAVEWEAMLCLLRINPLSACHEGD